MASATSALLERLARRYTVALRLGKLKSVASISVAEAKPPTQLLRITCHASWADGSHSTELITDTGTKLRSLPLTVDFHFLPPEDINKLEGSIGSLMFFEAIKTDDGVVDEVDQVILTICLPQDFYPRFSKLSAEAVVAVELEGFTPTRTGWSAMSSQKAWADSRNTPLSVVGCQLADPIG